MRAAVLALQGAFAEHERILEDMGVEYMEIRQEKDAYQDFDALILPGGESTAMGKLLRDYHLLHIKRKDRKRTSRSRHMRRTDSSGKAAHRRDSASGHNAGDSKAERLWTPAWKLCYGSGYERDRPDKNGVHTRPLYCGSWRRNRSSGTGGRPHCGRPVQKANRPVLPPGTN